MDVWSDPRPSLVEAPHPIFLFVSAALKTVTQQVKTGRKTLNVPPLFGFKFHSHADSGTEEQLHFRLYSPIYFT